MKKALNLFGKFMLWLAVTLVLVLVAFLIMIYMVSRGPSTQVRDLFVTSARETSAAGFLADLFLS